MRDLPKDLKFVPKFDSNDCYFILNTILLTDVDMDLVCNPAIWKK